MDRYTQRGENDGCCVQQVLWVAGVVGEGRLGGGWVGGQEDLKRGCDSGCTEGDDNYDNFLYS